MAVRPPSLRAIVAFEAAARHGGFRDAARELNLSDSAVGYAIRGLEARLGRRLFRRERSGLQLTADGRALAARVSLGLSVLSEAFDVRQRPPRTRLVVLAPPAFVARVLCPRLPAFLTASSVDIDLRASSEMADLGEAGVDVAVRFGAGPWAGLRGERLAGGPFIAVTSPAYRGGRLPRDVDDLAACDLIDEAEMSWRPAWEGSGLAGAPRRLTVDDLSTALSAAQAGAGVALAPWLAVADDIAEGRLVRVTGLAIASPCAFWLVWRSAADGDSLIAAFADWLAGEADALSQERLRRVA